MAQPIPLATQLTPGLMSAEDKAKLDTLICLQAVVRATPPEFDVDFGQLVLCANYEKGPFKINLPPAADGYGMIAIKMKQGVESVVVAPSGEDTIDNTIGLYTIPQSCVTLVSDGVSDWQIIATA